MKLKGIVFSGIISFIISIIAVGCVKNYIGEKQDRDKYNDFYFEQKNGHLFFPSFQDYEKAIQMLTEMEVSNELELWDERSEFKSQRLIKNEKGEEDFFVDDEILASLLNEHGEIEIADNLYRLNNITKKVEVVNIKTKTKRIYSFYDNILSEDNKNQKRCGIGHCKSFSFTKMAPAYNVDHYSFEYKKYGIYFTIITKIKSRTIPVRLTMDYNIVEKNGVVRKGQVDISDVSGGPSSNYKVLFRPYSGVRGVKNYNVNVKFYYGSYYSRKLVWQYFDKVVRGCCN